ncbi:Na+/H+ antiporter NhaA [Nocardioides sp. YIM 152315]|uniref:Na+/H+ antiporter NhaA n=1 Tax=Nocardioides sp. YIM 152315 TaxID=3031760 RepID=UPI0023D9B3EC|nr:Na+/H+ antiporter NhaA [Nocardioides sp. YIM 152315]MDF1603212.1 Na+/H+ antiporter NhaA [Nocardioides sp. YIM 152315]
MTGISPGRDRGNPLRRYVRTEAAGAAILLAAVAVAALWANLTLTGYEAFWNFPVAFRLGPWAGSVSAREAINEGLMSVFFLVVGLEARREFDLGELRERRNTVLPLVLGVGGMALPAAIYVVLTHGSDASHGWAAAMSTDTALALGAVTVLGRSMPVRVRTFLLTVLVVDDIAALIVVAVVYNSGLRLLPLAGAAVGVAGLVAIRRVRLSWRPGIGGGLALCIWGGLAAGGVDPVVAGLVVGLATPAHTPGRDVLEEATTRVRLFREQPVPELASAARTGLRAALSANTRLQYALHPWASRVVVPLFVLANSGVPLNSTSLAHAATSPVGMGIALGYLLGKPTALVGGSWLAARLTRGALAPQVGYGALLGSGVTAAIGLTVSLLVSNLAFTGVELQDAKVAVLTSAAVAALISGLVFTAIEGMPEARRSSAIHGTSREQVDLVDPVDEELDHVLGRGSATLTVVEYGDFECPWTAESFATGRDLIAANCDLRYVWRHLPLTDVHPHADLAAQAAEAAGAQGAFWPMHRALLTRDGALEVEDLAGHAVDLGLDLEVFLDDLRQRRHAMRVARDIESAEASGVAGTPTFFIQGRRHDGPPDFASLMSKISEAREHALAVARSEPAKSPGGSGGAGGSRVSRLRGGHAPSTDDA